MKLCVCNYIINGGPRIVIVAREYELSSFCAMVHVFPLCFTFVYEDEGTGTTLATVSPICKTNPSGDLVEEAKARKVYRNSDLRTRQGNLVNGKRGGISIYRISGILWEFMRNLVLGWGG